MGLISDLKKDCLWEEVVSTRESPGYVGIHVAWAKLFDESLNLENDALITETENQVKTVLMRNGSLIVIPAKQSEPYSIWSKKDGELKLTLKGPGKVTLKK